jgi:hypothetical protein
MHACRASDKMSAVTARFLFVFGALLLSASGVFADGEYQRTKNGKTIVWNNDPKPGDEASWSGDRDRNGYATGFGTLTWYTTEHKGEGGSARSVIDGRYWGNMLRGKFDGPVNAHSKGKTDHAIFADGKRTTRWAAGPAPSWRVAHSQAVPPAKPATAAEAPVEGPPAVRETENALATSANGQTRRGEASSSSSEQLRQPSRASSQARVRYGDPELVREEAARKAPNSESFPEQAAQGPIEEAPANELSLQRASPAKPAAAAEAPADEPPAVKETENAQPVSAGPSPVTEPEAPAEGPRNVREVENVQPASALNPESFRGRGERPTLNVQRPMGGPGSVTAEPEGPAEGPRAQPPMEDTPSVSIQPSKESVPLPPTSKKSQAEVVDSLQSFVRPPSSLLAIPETAGSPEASSRLTKEEVIRIANAAARTHGYNRADYERAEPLYNAAYNIWSVSYDQSAADEVKETGKHFNVIVDDKTKGTVFVLRR